MFLVAVTGGISTGKSTVTNIFRKHGVPVIDADLIAREVVEPGKPAWHKIRETFGDSVLTEGRRIDRDALGKKIFNDIELRKRLNEITHPVIHRAIIFQVFRYFMAGEKYVLMDLPLLFETGILLDFIYKIITVTCDDDTQVKRLMERNSFTEAEARQRISSQMPLEKKCEQSHFVIENSGNFAKTEIEVMKIISVLDASKHHWMIRFYIFAGFCTIAALLFGINYIFDIYPISFR